jgi:hypothetical protein
MRTSGRIERALPLFVGLVAGLTCLTGTALGAPLPGLSLQWRDAMGNEARLFFLQDGSGVARIGAEDDRPFAWNEPGSAQLCLSIGWPERTSADCGTIASADQGGDLLGSDGATIGALSDPLPFATLALAVEDATGRSGGGSFTASDEAGNVIGRSVARTEPLAVVAGQYYVEPELDPFDAIEIAVEPGTDGVARYRAEGSLWFTQQRSKAGGECCENRDVLLVLRPLADRQAILATRQVAAVGSPASSAEPRHGATAAAIAEAVRFSREFVDGGGAAADAPYAWLKVLASKAILVRYGSAGDVERLYGFERVLDGWQPVFAAAALEARLGAWKEGYLAVRARAGDLAAMAALANEGDRRWDAAMLASIADAPWQDASMALKGLRTAPAALQVEAGRAFMQRHDAEAAKANAEPDASKRVYPVGRGVERFLLLNSDAPDDLKRVNERSLWMAPWELSELMALVENPESLLWPADPAQTDEDTMTLVCAAVTGLSPDVAAGAYDRMRNKLVNDAYFAMMENGEISARADYQSRTSFGVYSSGCVPSDTIATYIDADYGGNLSLPAVRETWNEARVLEGIATANLNWKYFSQLDYLEPEVVAAALAGGAPDSPFVPLLGAFQAVMRFGTVHNDAATPYRADDARPYVMKLPTADRYGGTIAGLLRLVVGRGDGGLVLTLVPDHRIAYNDFCSLAATIATNCDQSQWLVHPYAMDPTALIDSVELRGPAGAIELLPAEAAEGAMAYLAGEQPPGLPQLTLFVTLRIASYEGGPPDAVREIAFPLEATPEARRERGLP